jgi:DUF971 family protein
MTPEITPAKLNLKRDEKLEIDWQDGRRSVYSISLLRSLCPCAQCRLVRDGNLSHDTPPAAPVEKPPAAKKKTSLTILPGNYAQPLSALSAELVGNYALRIEWSDGHGSGIYSFQYLREIAPQP